MATIPFAATKVSPKLIRYEELLEKWEWNTMTLEEYVEFLALRKKLGKKGA